MLEAAIYGVIALVVLYAVVRVGLNYLFPRDT